MWKLRITWFSYFVHIISILFSHFGARDPGLANRRQGARRPGFRAPKCENNMKIILNTHVLKRDLTRSHYFHMFFILFAYYFHILGPGTRTWAPKRRRAGPLAAALGPGPGFRAPKYENDMIIMWNKCENHAILHFHIIFYCFHIFGPGTRAQAPKRRPRPQNVKMVWK